MLRERPTNLKRYPDGVDGEPFYSKRLPKGAPPYTETARVTFPSGRTAEAFCPTEPAVLLWAANMGTFDFHPWPVRRADPDRPDELRIDLDPQPGTDFADAVAVAAVLHEVLDEAGLVGWPKTSGGRGVHVFARIRPEWDFIDVRHAVIAIARRVAERVPDAGHRGLVEGGARRTRVPRLQPGRARPHDRLGVVGARAAARAPSRCRSRGPTCPTVEPEDFDVRTVPGIYAERGDPHADMDAHVGGLETVLEWYAAERRGGDMPYPPEYPKMPGEPMRVQPSRARNPEPS